MKFRNKKTGAILIPTSNSIIEQMKKSDRYEEIKENIQNVKEPKEPTVAEIKAKLDELGIEYDKKATKADLLTLLPQK